MEAFAALPEHPVVVPFVDVDTAAGRHYLAWPWAEGHPFDRYVLRNGPIPSAEATRLFADLADGLRALHTAGLPHGLLRPRSLLLGMDRRPRILDAGLGAVLADNVGDERSMVDTLALASGSAAMADFAAPETLLDPTALSPAADAYSFGCCLYFVLTGLPPFPEELLSDKVIGHQQRSPVPVRTRNPDVPQVLADLIDRLMRKAPDERPSQFAEVRAELRAIADLPEMGGELTTSKSFTSVKAEALAALGKAASGSWTHARRADLPPASDVVDFDDVPLGPPPPPPQDDSQALTPPPPRRPPPPPTAPVERRMPSAEGGPRLKAAVEIPSPPAFDSAAARAVRSVLFWKKAADAVQLSVFGPPELAPGQRARLLVYAHLPDAFGGVATLCRALHPDAELLGTSYIQRPVRRDSVLQLHLQLTGGGVPKPMVEFTWTGQTHPRSFEVAVPLEAGGGVADGVLSAGQGEQKVGEVVFQMLIGGLGLGRGGG
jgi:serine/threonine protein kinase